jgi:DNA gyrase subunit A
LDLIDYITEEDMVVTVSHAGYIKRSPVQLYRSQRRGGKGRSGTRPREEDFVELLFVASTHDYLLFFTNLGRIHWLKVYQLPEAGPLARGKAIVNLLPLQEAERVATILPVREFETDRYVVMATRKGVVKKTALMAYGKPRAGGIIALKIDEGRVTRGVKGMNVDGSSLVGMEVVSEEATILTVSENGYGKRTRTKEYPLRHRGGKGVLSMRTTERNGPVVGFRHSIIGRVTQGVRLINIPEDERVVDMAILAESEEEESAGDEAAEN